MPDDTPTPKKPVDEVPIEDQDEAKPALSPSPGEPKPKPVPPAPPAPKVVTHTKTGAKVVEPHKGPKPRPFPSFIKRPNRQVRRGNPKR